MFKKISTFISDLEKDKKKRDKYIFILILSPIFLFFMLLVFVYLFFIIDGFLPTGNNLSKSDWLIFLGSYLSFFSGLIAALATIFLGIVAIIQNNNANKANKMLQETQLLYNTYTCVTLPREAKNVFWFKTISKKDIEDFSQVHCAKNLCFSGDIEDELLVLNIEMPFNTNNQFPIINLILKKVRLGVLDKEDSPETWYKCKNLNDSIIPSTWKYRNIYKDYKYTICLEYYFRKSDFKSYENNFGFNVVRVVLDCELTNAFGIVTYNKIQALYEVTDEHKELNTKGQYVYKTLTSSSDVIKTPYKVE